MFDDRRKRGAAEDPNGDWLTDAQPNLGPMRALADRAELTDAVSHLAGEYGCPLRPDDLHAPLAQDLARALTLAGLALHHCVQSHPLHRLGGVCLLPVAGARGPANCGGVVVSWTTHKLLSLDWDQWSEHQGAHAAMNRALAEVLDALGFWVQPFGQSGASLVTGRRAGDNRAETAR